MTKGPRALHPFCTLCYISSQADSVELGRGKGFLPRAKGETRARGYPYASSIAYSYFQVSNDLMVATRR